MDSSQTRHNLRKMISEDKLTRETLDAQAAEKERKKRLEEKRKLEEEMKKASDYVLGEDVEDIVLDFDTKTKAPLIKIDKELCRVLKPHQIEGIKFIWENCFEKVEQIQNGHLGSGCILAHCMGLGKTLQIVSLVHTLLSHEDLTKTKCVLILMPKNVQNNWYFILKFRFHIVFTSCDYTRRENWKKGNRTEKRRKKQKKEYF